MKRIVVTPQEEFRLDIFIINQYGSYSDVYLSGLMYFNPTVDFVNFLSGLTIKVPSSEELNSWGYQRGRYSIY